MGHSIPAIRKMLSKHDSEPEKTIAENIAVISTTHDNEIFARDEGDICSEFGDCCCDQD